jgi:hypothetical protein
MTKGITSKPVVRKEYSYQLKMTTLGFTLRQDNTQELLNFRELLKQALSDVEKDITDFRK